MTDLSDLLNGTILMAMINLGVAMLALLIQSLLVGTDLGYGLDPILSTIFVAIGLVQWLYVFFIWDWYRRRPNRAMAKGVIVGAVVTMLLNGGCWAALINGL